MIYDFIYTCTIYELPTYLFLNYIQIMITWSGLAQWFKHIFFKLFWIMEKAGHNYLKMSNHLVIRHVIQKLSSFVLSTCDNCFQTEIITYCNNKK